jgi:hypothetical protein
MMPMVMPGCRLAVLLVPPNLVAQLEAEYLLWREHWRVPSLIASKSRAWIVEGAPTVHVIPFSRFSRAESTALLGALKPDTIIIDEAHKARNADTATTSRILRYFADNPTTRLCCWSGSLTSKSILDYAHLSAFSLREHSPLPLDPAEARAWSLAIDPNDWQADPGALMQLCKPGEHIYDGFRRRLKETLGVVATVESSCDAALTINARDPGAIPWELAELMRNVRTQQTRPDGEELVEAIEVSNCVDQLVCGFFYRWKFPKGEPEELIDEWFSKRKEYARELRVQLMDRREHMDSPLLCLKAALRYYQGHAPPLGHGEPYNGPLPTWHAHAWPAWRAIMRSVYHETETVWVDDYLVNDAAAWARENRGIVWFAHTAFGNRLGEITGLPVFGGGTEAKAELRKERGERSIICSINAHGTGTDGLQHHFQDQLIVSPPGTGQAWEQLLGRLHRQGQNGAEIRTHVYQHTPELRDTLEKAVRQAHYIERTFGTKQKLLMASGDF